MKLKTITLLASLTGLTACSGDLYTVLNPDLTTADGKPKKVEGVIVYPPKQFLDTYKTTTYVTKDGQLVARWNGKEEKGCVPKTITVLSVRADYARPQRVFYDPGMLEEHSFGLTLKDGVLTGVNSAGKPDRGQTLGNVVEAATGLVGMLSVLDVIETKKVQDFMNTKKDKRFFECNSGKVLVNIQDVPKGTGTFPLPNSDIK